MAKLSFVTTAYNEEKKLRECLLSIKDIADEIIVINNSSIDKTEEIAKEFTKKIFNKENNLMLNVNKNFGFSKASSEWILNLDPDERLTPELKEEIKQILEANDKNIDGYYIPRKNIIFGQWIKNSIWWPDYQLRLFRKNKGKFKEKHVHELLEVDGKTKVLENPMLHLNYQSVSQFIKKMDLYTENEADNFLKTGKLFNPIDCLRMPINDFLKTFFSQKGYKDGFHGLVLSLLQSSYTLISMVKVWEKSGFKEYNEKEVLSDFFSESKKISKEIKYWILTFKIENSNNLVSKFFLKIKRKFLF